MEPSHRLPISRQRSVTQTLFEIGTEIHNNMPGDVFSCSSFVQEDELHNSQIPMSPTVFNGSLANTASFFGAHFATNMSLGNRPKSSLHRTEMLLVITELQILELLPSSSSSASSIIRDAHPLEGLLKVRFKGNLKGMLTLEYKSGKISAYTMDSPGKCGERIKERMLKLGIGNSVRKAARFMKYYDGAQHYFNRTKELEIQFSMTPHFKLIEEMMDLMRTAVELFDAANDKSYNDVVLYIRNFLQRADVVALLDANIRGGHPNNTDTSSSSSSSSSSNSNNTTTTTTTTSINVASELESIQAVIHFCPSLDDDHPSYPPTIKKKGTSSSSSSSSSSRSGGVVYEEDEDDITMQLSNMLNEMNQEFNGIVQSFSNSPRSSNTTSNSGSTGSGSATISSTTSNRKQDVDEELHYNNFSEAKNCKMDDLMFIIPSSSESSKDSIML